MEENRVEEVKEGYARNYLFPQKKAVLATSVNLQKLEKKRETIEAEISARKKEAEEIAKQLEGKELVIKAEAGEEGKLFGSVTTQKVEEEINSQFGISLNKKDINLNEHIGKLGNYTATAKIYHSINAHIKIKVEKL